MQQGDLPVVLVFARSSWAKHQMKIILKLLMIGVVSGLLLAACGGASTPTLPEAGQPTLVFIYTDG